MALLPRPALCSLFLEATLRNLAIGRKHQQFVISELLPRAIAQCDILLATFYQKSVLHLL